MKQYKVENKWIVYIISTNGKLNILPIRKYTSKDRRSIKISSKERFLAQFKLGLPNSYPAVINIKE